MVGVKMKSRLCKQRLVMGIALILTTGSLLVGMQYVLAAEEPETKELLEVASPERQVEAHAVASTAMTESEPNDKREAANPIPLGGLVTGSHGKKGDQDWYRFEVPGPAMSVLRLELSDVSGINHSLTVLDAEGKEIKSAVAKQGVIIPNLALSPGTYYARVSAYDQKTDETYKLQVQSLGPWDEAQEREPNDKRGQASPLHLGQSVTGLASLKQYERDWYRLDVDIPGRTTVRIALSAIEGIDTRFVIHDAQGRRLKDYNAVGRSEAEVVDDFTVSPGTYYIEVYPGSLRATDRYQLLVEEVGAWKPGWELEPNDTREHATPLVLDELVRGYLHKNDDDWYQFEIQQGSEMIYYLGVSGVPGFRYELEVNDYKGKGLDKSRSLSAGQGTGILKLQLAAGTYLARVRALSIEKDAQKAEPYKLVIHRVKPGEIDSAIENDSFQGHRYAVFHMPTGIDWVQAERLAEALGGYLAVITSEAENVFVYELATADDSLWLQADKDLLYGPWFGGYQIQGCPEPLYGWAWVNGESWRYANWLPDGLGKDRERTRDRLHFIGLAPEKAAHWGRLSHADYLNGFVVEWDNEEGGQTVQQANAKQSELPEQVQDKAYGGVVTAKRETSLQRTYTLDGDFDEGALLNVNHDAPNNHQLQLNEEAEPFPFINVAASARGTIVRINVNSGEVVGEFRTAPEERKRNPSRTTVDLMGNVWCGNRNEAGERDDPRGSVIKIGLIIGGTRVNADGTPDPEGGYLAPPFKYSTCVDRDEDGLIRTSRGLGDILAWPDKSDGIGGETGRVEDAEDECILIYQRTEATNVRHVSVDANNDIWVGGYNGGQPNWFNKLAADSGRIVERFSAADLGCGGYGGLIDNKGVLWSANTGRGKLLRYDVDTRTGGCTRVPGSYGLGIDTEGNVWNSTFRENAVRKNAGESIPTCGASGDRGVAVTPVDNHVWVANSSGSSVSRLDNDGNILKVIEVGRSPTGVAVDNNGKVWVTNLSSNDVMRIDPNMDLDGLGEVDLTVDLGRGASPYNYSDMTGMVALTATSRQGTWTAVQDTGESSALPIRITWNTEPQGKQYASTEIRVEVRSAETEAALGNAFYERVVNGRSLVLEGRIIQVRTTLRASLMGESPILSDLTIDRTAEAAKYLRPKGPGTLAVVATEDAFIGDHALQVELILDASGSMRERKRKIDGRLKIDVAKDVMQELIEGLPEGIEVALRVYGRRIREGRKGDCQDSELLVPFGKLDRRRLQREVGRIKALGTTPLGFSLLKAGEDLTKQPGEKVIILVTDGKEECGMDPAFAAQTLANQGLDLRVNVVGFALADAQTKDDMAQVAAITGGRFFDAQDRTGLLTSIRTAMAVPYQVINPDGQPVASGITGGQPIQVQDGIYRVEVNRGSGEPLVVSDIRVIEEQHTLVELYREAEKATGRSLGPYPQDQVEQLWQQR